MFRMLLVNKTRFITVAWKMFGASMNLLLPSKLLSDL